MARIILASYMVRYPLGGNLSWALQWLVGFKQLGHDVYFVEKAGYADACYDPIKRIMSDDCSYGVGVVKKLLERFGLRDRWCFVDAAGRYFGLSKGQVEKIFHSADLLVDMETLGSWMGEAGTVGLRALVELEPAYTQMKMEKMLVAGETLPSYDYYYTVGSNIGTEKSTVPTAGKAWRHVFNPVVMERFSNGPVNSRAPFTTVMNWQAHEPIEFKGTIYGQKDFEFQKFKELPRITDIPLEIAVSGKNVPVEELRNLGWRLRNSHEITISFDSYLEYIRESKGEFGVCKNVFVATNSGWFSDRSAAYLASGRPVVLQDTGFSEHLPCGKGLFAVSTVEEAAEAINEINANYNYHSNAAREIALEHLDAEKVLRRFLVGLGL